MRFSAWLLVLAGRNSATAQLLEGSGADLLDPLDASGIQAVLTARYQTFRRQGRPAPLGDREHFTRQFQAERLLRLMEAAMLPERSAGN
jgi:hypothetical protein